MSRFAGMEGPPSMRILSVIVSTIDTAALRNLTTKNGRVNQ
jgi:hypothetical protein